MDRGCTGRGGRAISGHAAQPLVANQSTALEAAAGLRTGTENSWTRVVSLENSATSGTDSDVEIYPAPDFVKEMRMG